MYIDLNLSIIKSLSSSSNDVLSSCDPIARTGRHSSRPGAGRSTACRCDAGSQPGP